MEYQCTDCYTRSRSYLWEKGWMYVVCDVCEEHEYLKCPVCDHKHDLLYDAPDVIEN